MIIKDLELEECRNVLAGKGVGRLACVRDGQPYVIPFHFAFDGQNCLYAFSTFGQKIDWMRSNPLVCVEVEEIKQQNDWTTLVIFGSYEELIDTPQLAAERSFAFDLLSQRPMWWQPAYVAGTHRTVSEKADPIYFRIHISQMTGHRASVDPAGSAVKRAQHAKRSSWWRRLWQSENSKPE
ncbi:pyridoxamine 5'-phosphate oxidase family protein [soil metagenome]